MLDNKYDLCSDTVTLDYQELIKTALVAVRCSLNTLEGRLRKWHDIHPKLNNLDSERLLGDAQALATATTTLHYLTEGLNREKVVLVRDAVEDKVE